MPEILRRKIGFFFLIKRRAANVSTRAAANKLGITTEKYKKFEEGKVDLPLSELAVLVDLFSMSQKDFLNVLQKLEVGFRHRYSTRRR
jgi:hypothetical protein